MLKYKKMSLFDAPKGSVLVHATNCQGVMGSGIAAEFKKRFPANFRYYRDQCYRMDRLGLSTVYPDENDYGICNLNTSNLSGPYDDPESILVSTTLALSDFINRIYPPRAIYSNKFNSGLFNVPWKKTEQILKYFVGRYDLDWTVCDPNMKDEDDTT